MIRFIVALAILFAFAREAAAETAVAPASPKLKELVTVTAEIVRIGDLVDNAGPAADIAVFRAPDLGQTGTVQVARVAEALRPHDVVGVDTGKLSEVVVTRLSRAITGADIAERIARALAGQYGLGEAQNISVRIDRSVHTLHVEASATADLAIARMYVESRTGRFDVAFELPGSAAARRLPLRFTGTVVETVEAATLTRAIRRGEIIKASDVQIERRPKTEVAGDTASAEELVGLSAKNALRAGQVLRPADLMKPEAVQRNQAVTIVFEAPGILLTVRGKALEAGAVGDMIGVLNVQSNRTVQATVSGPGRVTIAATTPRVASVVAPATQDTAQRRAQ